ncbi:AraC family transcriptional regulator [Pedobacter rhizosphaerae]|uniref:Helix-turn-helix domain-containing protein n=1 Tax=Pedobacter rhizosphaerae TaxID=390241 RepID=A0A1H9KHJ9_9SPHI|nr:helix-turn-helix domain-containing protein [Pedobacter rhizosphaerae]SEQ98602.1 Helix-turn-helix domain-containing protein [Pedobacter rhizosphaerae]
MKRSFDIRTLYNPIQPTVKQFAEQVSYQEVAPDISLQPYIYCYWQLQTHQVLAEPFIYRVVADGCIDIFFELHHPQENFIMGFCKKFTEFPLESTFNYIGIRFLPSMFPQLFNINARDLSNRFVELNLVLPQVAQFIAQHFSPAQNLQAIKTSLDTYFCKHLSGITLNYDNRLYHAIDIILKQMGVIDIEQDLDTGVSSRQLRRLFEFYIGDTPKTFSQVVRFQNILRAKPSTQSLKQNKLFYQAGYYDQAHFIKEFKHFYGVTPSKAFGR